MIFQTKTVNEIEHRFENGEKAICLAYYTGSGKTNIFLELVRKLLVKNPKAKIGISSYLTGEVRDQTFERSQTLNIKSYLADKNNIFDKDKNVFIFNPQKIYKVNKAKKVFDYFIIDECQAGFDETAMMINSIIKNLCHKNTKILLVSATPWDILAQERFKDITVLKRSIDEGIKDDRIADVEIIAEENQIEFKEAEYTRKGDLGKKAISAHYGLLKSICIGKMENIIKKYGDSLGNSILVICPPGNTGEIAREMAERFNGLFFIEEDRVMKYKSQENLKKFTQGKSRFLFVIYKCSVGFDYPEMDSIIDLTMTRNIKTFVQRLGRVARKSSVKKKRFIYCYDKSLGVKRLEWLIGTAVDFSCGNFDGWTSKTSKYRPLRYVPWYRRQPNSVLLSEVINDIAKPNSMKTIVTLNYTEAKPPKFRTIETAKEEASQYLNRHELFKENPSLYKWFRLNGHLAELNKIHPLMNLQGKWNERNVIAALKRCKRRSEFNDRFSGAKHWIRVNNRNDLIEKHLPAEGAGVKKWNEESVRDILRKCKSWSDFRYRANGARDWLRRNGRYQEFKELFNNGKI